MNAFASRLAEWTCYVQKHTLLAMADDDAFSFNFDDITMTINTRHP